MRRERREERREDRRRGRGVGPSNTGEGRGGLGLERRSAGKERGCENGEGGGRRARVGYSYSV